MMRRTAETATITEDTLEVEAAMTPEPKAKPKPKAKAKAATSGVDPAGVRWVASGNGTYRVNCTCRWRYAVSRPGLHKCPECGRTATIG